MSGLPYDLMIYCAMFIIFVKVKRVQARIDGPEQAEWEFRRLIRDLRMLPPSPVAVLELWVISSHKTWQHFLILPDRVIEIRGDGTPAGSAGTPKGGQPPDSPGTSDAQAPEETILPSPTPENVILDLSKVET